jgi:hypothetical protein
MAAVVAIRAALHELLDDRSLRLLVGRIVIALEQLGRTAVDTTPVALVHDPPLPDGRMTPPTRRIDRPTLCVVDQGSKESPRRDPFDDCSRNRRPVVERAAITSYVQHDLGNHAGATAARECDQRVGSLLRDRRPPRRVRGRVRPVPPHQRVDATSECHGLSRWEPELADDHSVDVDVPPEAACLLLADLRLGGRFTPRPPRGE